MKRERARDTRTRHVARSNTHARVTPVVVFPPRLLKNITRFFFFPSLFLCFFNSRRRRKPGLTCLDPSATTSVHFRDDLDLLHLEARGEGLLELVRLVGVVDAQRVEVLAAAHLELRLSADLLDLDGCCEREEGKKKKKARE